MSSDPFGWWWGRRGSPREHFRVGPSTVLVLVETHGKHVPVCARFPLGVGGGGPSEALVLGQPHFLSESLHLKDGSVVGVGPVKGSRADPAPCPLWAPAAPSPQRGFWRRQAVVSLWGFVKGSPLMSGSLRDENAGERASAALCSTAASIPGPPPQAHLLHSVS